MQKQFACSGLCYPFFADKSVLRYHFKEEGFRKAKTDGHKYIFVAEAMGLANSLPNCTGVFTSFMTRDRYLSWFYSYLEGFLDWETGTAHFEDLDFQNMLTFANTLPTERPLENTTDAEIICE